MLIKRSLIPMKPFHKSSQTTRGQVYGLAAAFALLIGLAPVQAATLTQTDTATRQVTVNSDLDRTTSSRTASTGRTVTNDNQASLVLDKFDSSLGTLDSIQIIAFTNATNSFGSVRVRCTDSGAINSSCASQSARQTSTRSAQIDVPFDGTGFGTSFNTLISASDFNAFTGAGTFVIPWRVSYTHSATASCTPSRFTSVEQCRVLADRQFQFFATARVIYTYTTLPETPAVPLPATGWLLLGGLAALGLRRRKA